MNIYIYMRMCVSIRYDSSKMETIIIIFHKALIIRDKKTSSLKFLKTTGFCF